MAYSEFKVNTMYTSIAHKTKQNYNYSLSPLFTSNMSRTIICTTRRNALRKPGQALVSVLSVLIIWPTGRPFFLGGVHSKLTATEQRRATVERPLSRLLPVQHVVLFSCLWNNASSLTKNDVAFSRTRRLSFLLLSFLPPENAVWLIYSVAFVSVSLSVLFGL